MTGEEAAPADLSEAERFARHCAHERVLELADCCPSLADGLTVVRLMRELIDLEWPPGLITRERFLSVERYRLNGPPTSRIVDPHPSWQYTCAMPTIDFPDDELAAVTAALRRAIEDDRYPHAPRLDPLRAALARLEGASKPTPKAPPSAKADKGARSAKEPAPKISPGFKLGRLPPDR
jgi:hypothetical protein